MSSEEAKTERIRENVLDWFRKIGIDNEKVIIKNGMKLLEHLIENKESENGKNELKYALTRLIRGLGASSNSTKQGYYTVLIGLLNCFDEIRVIDVLEVGRNELATSAGNSKSENADISAGQILLYGALIRCGLFDKAGNDEKKNIVENLISAGKKRNYLFLLAATFINQLCNNVDENYFKLNIFPIISPELMKPWPEQTADTLYLLFVLNDRFPNVVNKKYIKSILGAEEIVSVKNLPELANVLINMPRLETANHPVYDLLSKKLAQKKFVDFISESDKLLFKYNYNRHMIFTLILTSIVTNLNDLSVLPRLITRNYIQQSLQYFKTIKNSKNPEQLQQKIYDLLNKIVEVLNDDAIDPEIKINVIKKFLFDPGTFIFEKLTRTKIIQQIINNLNRKGVDLVADLFKNVILSSEYENNDEKRSKNRFLNNDKVYATQLLVKLINHDKIKDDFDWKINQIEFLLELSFIKNDKIGVELMNSIKQSFFKCLTLKQSSFEAFRNILWKLSTKLNDCFNKKVIKCNDEVEKSWKKAFGLFEMVEKRQKLDDEVSIRLNHIYQTMFLFLGFHSFQDWKLTEESLIDLENCFQRKNLDQDLHFTEVLIDLFLCLLSYNSLLFRNLINMVFPHFTQYLTDGAFLQVLFVLNPENKNILSGRNQKIDENESEKSDESSSEDDENEDSSESSDFGDFDDDDNDDNKNMIKNQQNEKLKDALQSVLGNFGDEEIDLDEMSESEGQKLDEALSIAFKHNLQKRKNQRQSHKDKLKMNFRIRTLDLVDLYLENNPSLLICIEMIPVLLRLEEFAIKDNFQSQLLERVRKTIKKLTYLKKFDKINDEIKLNDLFLIYIYFLEKGDKNVYLIHALRESFSNLTLFLIRSSQFLINSSTEIDKKFKMFIENMLTETLKIIIDSYFLNRESIVSFDLLKTIIRLNIFNLYDLIEKVLKFIYLEDLKMYKKIQAIDLAKEFFKNHRFLTSKIPEKTFKATLNNFITTTEAIFEYSIDNKSQIKEKFIKILLDLLISIKSSSTTTISCQKLIHLFDKYKENEKLTRKTTILLNKFKQLEGKVENFDTNQKEIFVTNESVGKSKRNLKEKIDEIKNKLGQKRKSEDVVDENIEIVEVKKIKLTNGDEIKSPKLTNGVENNLKTRRSLNVEKKMSLKSEATKKKKRQSSVF